MKKVDIDPYNPDSGYWLHPKHDPDLRDDFEPPTIEEAQEHTPHTLRVQEKLP